MQRSDFTTRRKFFTDLTLEPTKSQRVGLARPATEEDSEFVTLSTTHAAKGLHWRSVYVLNVIEGGSPSSRAETELKTGRAPASSPRAAATKPSTTKPAVKKKKRVASIRAEPLWLN